MRDEFQEYMSRRAAHLDRQQNAIEQGYGNKRAPEETAFEAGYRAGAHAMRERAADLCFERTKPSPGEFPGPDSERGEAMLCSAYIRALPVEE